MKRSLLFLMFVSLFFSCKEEKVLTAGMSLEGQWDFVKAMRNGKETKTLNSGYFKFNESQSTIESNIFQTEPVKPYQLENNTIKILGDEGYDLNIEMLTGDSMRLKGTIWKFKMEFLLVKQDTVQSEPVEL